MNQPITIGSMYGVYTYFWLIFMVDVANYTIHGYYGNDSCDGFSVFFTEVKLDLSGFILIV